MLKGHGPPICQCCPDLSRPDRKASATPLSSKFATQLVSEPNKRVLRSRCDLTNILDGTAMISPAAASHPLSPPFWTDGR
jgi:hypothetical protein